MASLPRTTDMALHATGRSTMAFDSGSAVRHAGTPRDSSCLACAMTAGQSDSMAIMAASRGLAEWRRKSILDAAVEVVSERGFDLTTVDLIAARCGASKATVYRHWPDKNALLIDAVRHHVPVLVPGQACATFEEDVLIALQAATAWARDNAKFFTAILYAGHHDPAFAAQTQRHIAAPHDSMWDAIAVRWESPATSGAPPFPWLRQVCEGFLLQQLLPDAPPPTDGELRTFVTEVIAPIARSRLAPGI
jgi:AcrR family transcriptional regulator